MSRVPPLETGHTPGPWKAEPFRVKVPTTQGVMDGPLMSYLAGGKHTAPGMTVSIASEREADHYLCAAAPDLLAACLLAWDSIPNTPEDEVNQRMNRALEAAIAKASRP